MTTQVETHTDPESSLSRPIIHAVTITKMARGAFYVLLTAFIAYQFEITSGIPAETTQALVSFATMVSLLRPLLGYWNDTRPLGKRRRKPFMTLGNILFIASVAMLLVLPNPSTSAGFYMAIAAFVIYGFGEAFIDVSTDALLLDVATTQADKNRIQAMARTGAIAGIMIAYGLGSVLVGAAWAWFLVSIGAMVAIGTILTLAIQEPAITSGQVQEQISHVRPTVPATYKATLWIAGVLMLLSTLSEGLVNVQLEPWLIDRYGSLPTQFYLVELLGAAISLAIVGGIAASRRALRVNLGRLVIPSVIVTAVFYAGLPWLAPTLESYFVLVTIKGIGVMLFTLAADRLLMDVVKGARKGATFQYFVLFVTGGAYAGGILGSMLRRAIGMEGLLLLVAAILVVALLMYVFVLAPRLKEART